jgi:hypothetical protein
MITACELYTHGNQLIIRMTSFPSNPALRPLTISFCLAVRNKGVCTGCGEVNGGVDEREVGEEAWSSRTGEGESGVLGSDEV